MSPVHPEDFFSYVMVLNDEEVNAKRSTLEMIFRTILNRIYYGVLHHVKQAYSITVPENQVARLHAFVKDRLENELHNDTILELYNLLELKRVRADYFLNDSIRKEDVNDALKIQVRLLDLIQENPEFFGTISDDATFFQERKRKP